MARSKRKPRRLTRREVLQWGITGTAVLLAPVGRKPVRAATGPAIARKVRLTYWTTLDHNDLGNARSKAEVGMVDLFRKKFPTVEVVPATVPWQVMDKQLIQAAAAGKAPDVAVTSTQGVPLMAPVGVLVNLDDHVGKHWTKEEREDFLLPRANTVYDGKNYGYYWNSVLNDVLFYRRDLLDAKKLPVPRTWAEIAETAKTLTEGRVAGYIMGLSKEGNAVHITNWLIPALWSVGADWLDAQGQVAFATESGARPFQWLFDLVHKYKATPEGIVAMNLPTMLDAFKSGTTAMTHMATNQLGAARTSAVGKSMGIAPAPGPTADKPQPAFSTGKFIVMTKDCKEREAAGLFIESMISPEAQLINARVASELPSRGAVLKDPWFSSPEAADMKLLVQYMQRFPRPFQYHPKNNVLGDLVANAFQAIIAKRAAVREALNDVAKKWEAEVKGS